MKRFLSVFLLSTFASSFLLAGAPVKVNDELSYDANNGWWWYEETYKDPATKKEETIKYKMSPAEKAKLDREKETQKLLKVMIEEQKENNKISSDIAKRLNYAFPDVTPEFTVSKITGKKCKTNTSSDCFIMPVTAEGQQVPVLKEFLREPSPSKAKEWLKWQATYFNHVQKVSHGLRFAFLAGGNEAYPTTTNFALGDSVVQSGSEIVQGNKEALILRKHKANIAYLIFVGQNQMYETLTKTYYRFHDYDKTWIKEFNYVLVYPSEESKKYVETMMREKLGKKEGEVALAKFFKTIKSAVRPDLYKQYDVKLTPSVVLFYENKKTNKKIWQIIQTGQTTASTIRRNSINFLTYNGIVNEQDMSADLNWGSVENVVNSKKIDEPNFKEIFDDYNPTEEEK